MDKILHVSGAFQERQYYSRVFTFILNDQLLRNKLKSQYKLLETQENSCLEMNQ